jgi:glycerol-3-phosphate dehydrogenase
VPNPSQPTAQSSSFQALSELEARGTELDVLIIGGGINGAGIARDAARRGLSVAVIEQNDLAFGTSSRSSKLIHGGLRYLEQYRVHLVFESVSERQRLMACAPHLVQPLGFLFPVYKGDKQPLALIRAGMWLYDGLSLFRSPQRHRTLDPEECKTLVPELDQDGLSGAPLYWDCATDDARLTLETAIDATRFGAIVSTWTEAVGFTRGTQNRYRQVRVRSVLDGREVTLKARSVVNATGPWSDATLDKPVAGDGDLAPKIGKKAPLLRPTKGVHIVVDSARLNLPHAVVCRHPDDKRVLFAIPWGDRTYVGTTDTDEVVDPSEVRASHEDVRYLLASIASYFPTAKVGEEDVIATWAGLRPLISEGDAGASESEVSREHKILVGDGGMITVAGGKLTTYRKMAAEVVDVVVAQLSENALLKRDLEPSKTEIDPLPGGVGFDGSPTTRGALKAEVAGLSELDDEICEHLVSTYGSRAKDIATLVARDRSGGERLVAGRPEILAQVDFAIDQELAATACDVLCRRTQLSLRDVDQGLGAVDRVIARMKGKLAWTEARATEERARYQHEVDLSRAWRSEP